MLGFSSLSESSISSLSSIVFYIGGDSDILIVVDSVSSGKLDIFGNQVNIIGVESSGVGYVKITKRRKVIIAQAVQHNLSSISSSPSVNASSDNGAIYAVSPRKKITIQ